MLLVRSMLMCVTAVGLLTVRPSVRHTLMHPDVGNVTTREELLSTIGKNQIHRGIILGIVKNDANMTVEEGSDNLSATVIPLLRKFNL